MEIDKVFNNDVDGVADNLFSAVKNSVAEVKVMQQRKAAENVQLVIQALKKIDSDIRNRFDDVGTAIEKRVASIKDGKDGINGKDGREGKDGRPGKDGAVGPAGRDGLPGRNGVDGINGVGVASANIDFDGSLIISLDNGHQINVGEVVAPDLAERIKIITNGGGTSQYVLDTLASLQTQITALIPSQTGNSGKYLTTNGTTTSWAAVAGGVASVNGYTGTVVLAQTDISGTASLTTTQTLTNKTLTSPKINEILDANGNEILGLSTTASATDFITVKNGIGVGVPLHVYADGSSSNIGLHIQPKGTGLVTISDGADFDKGIRFRSVSSAASAITLIDAVSTAGRVVTLPDATTTLVGRNTTDTLTNKTLTGAVMNGTLGATTPSTASVTTLTTSSTITHNGGTANGVAYLDGSKVLTTGSALVFDATNTALSVGGAALGTAANRTVFTLNGVSSNFLSFGIGGTRVAHFYSDANEFAMANAAASGFITFQTNSTERARIDSSGNLLVGTTSGSGSRLDLAQNTSQTGITFYQSNNTTACSFIVESAQRGYISVATSGTTYATSSDYRLKEQVHPMSEALIKVMALKPVTYKWKEDGSDGQGFIAHELQAIIPDAVIGEKDAMNEDGSIKPQGIDTSFLVATLTAAIQEQQALITTLTARITALESA
jgi:hypothetical protein